MFRRAYDAIAGVDPTTAKDLASLRILHLAAATIEAEVELALTILLDAHQVPALVPELGVLNVDLAACDELLTSRGMS